MTKKLLPLLALLVLAAPAPAAAARFAVGLERGATRADVARELRAATGGSVEPAGPVRARAARAERPWCRRHFRGVRYVERLDSSRRVAFVPTDPLFAKQWYLQQIRAFDSWTAVPPPFNPRVRVAVIDSGIDAAHPDLVQRIESGQSFVGGSWQKDAHGHGTFVAGIIAAETGNAEGIAGIGLGADLLVAKVVRDDGSISLEAEAKAIRWAVRQGAKVINLSFGGVRDPSNSKRDTYSRLEAEAIEWAVRHGVVVVAAVGNGDQAPSMPWSYASYPAALPHVLGVSALARDGSVPAFSNRDGASTTSPHPASRSSRRCRRRSPRSAAPACSRAIRSAGRSSSRRPKGTSFAAPQVAAAAALLSEPRAAS